MLDRPQRCRVFRPSETPPSASSFNFCSKNTNQFCEFVEKNSLSFSVHPANRPFRDDLLVGVVHMASTELATNEVGGNSRFFRTTPAEQCISTFRVGEEPLASVALSVELSIAVRNGKEKSMKAFSHYTGIDNE